ncbi:uncharacterized protein LOC134531555 [Bacillus rossius redtenbacheri]|uniref:uncharacterized protein LOC134531555 n=1 Tax=Bacillus rossius redtenbacheri TaxID=93214 RepID=UPI002FDDB454
MSDSRNYSKQFLTEFLEVYRSEPCLWKVKSKEYLNRDKKAAAYERLVSVMKTVDCDATRESVVKKINNFWSNFRKELKKHEDSKTSGVGSDDVYTPKLWYLDLLLFLQDQETPKQSTSNLDSCEDAALSDESNSDISATNVTLPTSQQPGDDNISFCSTSAESSYTRKRPTTKKRKDCCDGTQTEKVMSLVSELLQTMTPEDSSDVFGKHVAYKLHALDENQRIFAEKFINDVLYEASLGGLSRDFHVGNVAHSVPVTNITHQPLLTPYESMERHAAGWQHPPSNTQTTGMVTSVQNTLSASIDTDASKLAKFYSQYSA